MMGAFLWDDYRKHPNKHPGCRRQIFHVHVTFYTTTVGQNVEITDNSIGMQAIDKLEILAGTPTPTPGTTINMETSPSSKVLSNVHQSPLTAKECIFVYVRCCYHPVCSLKENLALH